MQQYFHIAIKWKSEILIWQKMAMFYFINHYCNIRLRNMWTNNRFFLYSYEDINLCISPQQFKQFVSIQWLYVINYEKHNIIHRDINQKAKNSNFSKSVIHIHTTWQFLHFKWNKIPQISIQYIKSSISATTFNTWCTARDVIVTSINWLLSFQKHKHWKTSYSQWMKKFYSILSNVLSDMKYFPSHQQTLYKTVNFGRSNSSQCISGILKFVLLCPTTLQLCNSQESLKKLLTGISSNYILRDERLLT